MVLTLIVMPDPQGINRKCPCYVIQAKKGALALITMSI